MYKVSVLMSVYHEKEEWLRCAIESILGQSFEDFEFLIYDDATSEENKTVLKEYAEKDSRIRVIENEKNQGLTYNLVRGVKAARGTYIARMDSDDISKSFRFARQIAYMERHPDVALLTARVCKMGGKKCYFPRLITAGTYLKTSLLFNNSLPHPTAIMRREFLEQYGINYDIEVKKAQDYDLWVRIAKKGKIAFLRTPLVQYRIHEGQISSKHAGEQRHFVDRVRFGQLHSMGIDLSEEEKQTYLDFCEGKLGKRSWGSRKTIKKIQKAIAQTGNYNNFWLWYVFRVRLIRNWLYQLGV